MTLQDLLNDPTLLDKLREEFQAQVYLQEVELDNYYDRLGEIVEQYPIVSAGIRRA